MADARHDDRGRPLEIGRRRRVVQLGANRGERLAHRRQVAGLVVDERNHSSPLVLGSMRASRLSFAQATRSARANALNTASILMMARSAVQHLDVDVRARADREALEEVVDQLGLQIADARDADLQVDDGMRPAAEIDGRDGQRLVHRHHEVAGAIDAAPRRRGLSTPPRRARCRDPRRCDADRRRGRRSASMRRSNAPWRAKSSSM